MVIELRNLRPEHKQLIHELFKKVYPESDLPFFHWDWMFACPREYIPVGLFIDNKLIGFYSAIRYHDYARMHGTMIDPKFQGQGHFKTMFRYIISLLQTKGVKFIECIANETIKPIYEKLGCYIDRQIYEYRITPELENPNILYNKTEQPLTKYDSWRYTNHLYKTYHYYIDNTFEHCAVFSVYDDRLQIVEFDEFEFAMFLACDLAKEFNCNYVSFWHEEDFPLFNSIPIKTWRMYKELNGNIGIKSNRRLRMGNNTDVY